MKKNILISLLGLMIWGCGNLEPEFEITAKELFNAFDTNNVQAQVKYFDKIADIKGTVKITGVFNTGSFYISLDAGNKNIHWAELICYFGEKGDEIQNLKSGDKVTVRGKIGNYGGDMISVENCSLVYEFAKVEKTPS